ncbi:hypothetical protein GCM10025876_33250 [Demequina litorisediminis]|uniref:K Homology domain-containing protein n=2 Tax=Demequina litorisediminis TaxID=1849022 RepID=A0ABQ6IHC8_9MICO|nr:hypothetical protein GCM10025876_33250 [Demequina litorisediminis]
MPKPAYARSLLIEAKDDARAETRRIERQAKSSSERRVREILVSAMQRQAARTSADAAATWVDLPSDDMKGRIIGREGRNIRAFESITGVNVIVEEGVNAVQPVLIRRRAPRGGRGDAP